MSVDQLEQPDVMDEIDLTEDAPCMGTGPRLPCIAGNPAELLLRSHTAGGVVMCWECWAESDLEPLTCPASRAPESRDEHYTIVEKLR